MTCILCTAKLKSPYKYNSKVCTDCNIVICIPCYRTVVSKLNIGWMIKAHHESEHQTSVDLV